ncbi:hypothetical protein ABZ766_04180 [Streptomyces sp. NPDC006670]|uniref:hypothetical protein n=1 Tax=Streptomyces sp. NPDC006670 TaxID=3154476 RepID=UPI0033C83890
MPSAAPLECRNEFALRNERRTFLDRNRCIQEPALVMLARHPVFAESARILSRLYETYDYLLDCIAPHEWPTGPGQRRILPESALEPTVRHGLDQALRRIRNPPACKAELTALADGRHVDSTLAAEEERVGLRQAVELPGHQVHLLIDPALPAPGHQEFQALFRQYLSAGGTADTLAGCTAEQAGTVLAAVELLLATAPDLCTGLLRHGRYIVAVDGPDAFEVSCAGIPLMFRRKCTCAYSSSPPSSVSSPCAQARR